MRTRSRLNVLAVGKALPQVTEKVGLLLNVAFTKQGRNGPGCLLGMVERNTTVAMLVGLMAQGGHEVRLTGTCGGQRGTQ